MSLLSVIRVVILKLTMDEFRGQQMAINQLKGLPLGTSDFIALRMADEIYVDKTEMVFSLGC